MSLKRFSSRPIILAVAFSLAPWRYVIAQSPNSLPANTSQAWLALASDQELAGDLAGSAKSLAQAIELESDPLVNDTLRIRLAVLRADANLSDTNATFLPTTRVAGAGLAIVAAIYESPEKTAQLIGETPDLFEQLLRGSSLLSAGDAKAAERCFQHALSLTENSRDQRFVLDRIVATARASSTLSVLADSWISDKSLSSDRVIQLAAILRELGRADDLLKLWKNPPTSLENAPTAMSRIFADVAGAADEANRLQDVERLTREAWTSKPSDPRWVGALVDILLRQDRLSDADIAIASSSAAASSTRALLAIAEIAVAAWRDTAALAVLDRLSVFPEADRVPGELYASSIERRRGNTSAAEERLRRATMLAGDNSSRLNEVARTLEKVGQPREALVIYRRLAVSDEDARFRLAWLLREDGKFDEALSIWTNLAKTAGSPARRRDARARALELAGRNGTIGDIAAEIEKKISADTATQDDVEELVDIYIGIGDPLSAAQIIRKSQKILGGEISVLNNLVQLYLRASQFGLADRTLRQLLVADPANAVDIWQQIAALAIERSRADDAREALSEIAKLSGDTSSTAEISAGIYTELNMHRQAADAYSQALAGHPEKADLWLLWAAAMKKDHRVDIAIERLTRLALTTSNEEMLAVAIDGLLNLDAPRPALRLARRAAILRLATGKRRQMMIELIRDLSDTLGDKAFSFKVADIGLLAAGEQRTELLREMISLSIAAGQPDRALDYQRTLLAMGDEVPPQVFLDIGRRLLTDGRLLDAANAFRRAEAVAEDDSTRMQIGALYEKAGQAQLALRILDPFVRQQPERIDLRVQVGGLYEQAGNFSASLNHYLAAVSILIRQGGAAEALKPAVSFDAGVSKSVTDAERYVEGLVRGMLYSARTPEQIDTLANAFVDFVHEHPGYSSRPAADNLDPAFIDLVRFARLIFFRIHRPEAADTLDLELCRRFPKSQSLVATAISDRIDNGLLARAASISSALSSPAISASTSSPIPNHPLSPDESAALLPSLFLNNRLADARTVLTQTSVSAPTDPQAFPLLVAASHALEDPARTWAWCNQWISYASRAQAGAVDPSVLFTAARGVWPVLPIDRQHELLQLILPLVNTAPESARAQVALLAVEISLSLNLPAESRTPLALKAATAQYLSPRNLVQLIASVPAADRLAILEAACRPLPSNRRRTLLLDFIVMGNVSLPSSDLPAFTALVPPPNANAAADADEQIPDRDATLRGLGAPELWTAFANAFVPSTTNSQADPIRAAQAFASANTPSAIALADRLATAELLRLTSSKPNTTATKLQSTRPASTRPQPSRRNTTFPAPASVFAAAHILSHDAAQSLFNELSAKANATPLSANAADLLLLSALQDTLGNTDSSFDLLAQAFKLEPENAILRRELILRYRADLRFGPLQDLFKNYQNDPRVVDDFARSSIAAAKRETEDSPNTFVSVFQIFPARPGDSGSFSDRELQRFRAFHRLLREKRQYVTYPARRPAAAGGFVDFDRNSTGAIRSIYQALAAEPWAPQEYLAVLATTPANAFESVGILNGLAVLPVEGREQVMRQLESYAARDALTSNDRRLLIALLTSGTHPKPEHIPLLQKDLQVALTRTISSTSAPTSSLPEELERTAAISNALRILGQPISPIAQRWLNSATLVLGPSSNTSDLSTPIIQSSPPQLYPSPGTDISDRSEADYLLSLANRDLSAAHARFDNLVRCAYISPTSHVRIYLVGARIAALQTDIPAFQSRLSSAIISSFRRSYSPVPDLALAIPDHPSTALISAALEVLTRAANQSPFDRPKVARTAALLGRCALAKFEADDNPSYTDALRCLEFGQAIAPSLGEHQLWLADLARAIKSHDIASAIESKLAAHHLLPARRQSPVSTKP